LTDDEFKAVFKGIEAYHSEGLNLINWRAILSAPVGRETHSFMGMFPRIVSKTFITIDIFVLFILEKERAFDNR